MIAESLVVPFQQLSDLGSNDLLSLDIHVGELFQQGRLEPHSLIFLQVWVGACDVVQKKEPEEMTDYEFSVSRRCKTERMVV